MDQQPVSKEEITQTVSEAWVYLMWFLMNIQILNPKSGRRLSGLPSQIRAVPRGLSERRGDTITSMSYGQKLLKVYREVNGQLFGYGPKTILTSPGKKLKQLERVTKEFFDKNG